MSVDCNDIFGNVKETFNSLGTFHFTPDIDIYETPQEFEHLRSIAISEGEENHGKNKKKPKPKRIQKKKLPNIDDDDSNYEPDDTEKNKKKPKPKRIQKKKLPNIDDDDSNYEPDDTEKNKNKPKPKHIQKKKLSNLDDDDSNYEPDDAINICYNARKRRTSKRLKKSTESNNDNSIIDIITPPRVSRGRGRGNVRQRGRGRGSRRHRSMANNSIITYNIGNTLEYSDELENVPMFNTQCDDVIELDDCVDIENEEMSVKIEWQSVEIFKFTIRKFQNLKVIFDFFCYKYNVEKDNLLFMYDNKILQPDDTPDTIGYRESKLIDGGIIYKNKMKISKNIENVKKVELGIQIKFQYKNSKHPFIVYVENNDKLSLAMMKCAEKLEIPINKLKFEFDGDIVSGKQTPNDLDLEGGECIDVKIIK